MFIWFLFPVYLVVSKFYCTFAPVFGFGWLPWFQLCEFPHTFVVNFHLSNIIGKK